MKKRTLALLLALTLLLFAGCAPSAEKPADEQQPSQPTDTNEPAEPDTKPADKGDATPTDIEFWTFQELHVEFYKMCIRDR